MQVHLNVFQDALNVVQDAEENAEVEQAPLVKVNLEVTSCKPKPRALELSRQNNSGTSTLANSLYDILQSCQLEVRFNSMVPKQTPTALGRVFSVKGFI